MTNGIALEIYANGKDLAISVYKVSNPDGWGVTVTRGHAHKFKMLLSTPDDQSFSTIDAAAEAVEWHLQTARRVGEQNCSPYADQDLLLTEDRIREIVTVLRGGVCVETWKLFENAT